jgi:hypothetical protein
MKNNEKMTIDDQVRAALENFAQPYNAEHWQGMTERLDALDAADSSFDAAARGRLTDILALPMADAWSKMSEKLDDLDAKDASFDNAFRGRLADVAVVGAMGDWSKMAEKLDNADDAEADFDDVLRRKLENIAGKHPNHWAMMNERLDREFTLKGKILRYKIIEAALMLFAFFTVLNVIDFNTEGSFDMLAPSTNLKSTTPTTEDGAKLNNSTMPSESPKSSNQQFEATPQAKTRLQPATNDTKFFDKSSNWRLRGGIQNGQRDGQNGQNAQPSQPNLMPTGQPIVENTTKKDVYTEGSFSELKTSLRGTKQTNSELKTGNAALNSELNTKNEVVLVNTEAVKSNDTKAVSTNQSVVDATTPIMTLQANLLTGNALDAPINIIKPNPDKKGKWRISTFGTAALDWVTTSFVYNREQHYQKQTVANAGISALVAYRKGNIEVESGLTVNRKEYSIANAKTVTGSFFRSYQVNEPDRLRLSIVSVPLNINVKLTERRRLNMYAQVGGAVNAIVDGFNSGQKLTTVEPTNGPAPAPQPSPDNVDLAIYSKGLINGGETKDNIFWTGHVGIGVEYKLSPKTSLFLQPTASFMLDKGVGSLNDRINSYSIQGGAKWKL